MYELVLRDARDSDAAGLIELIGSVFREYPNCVLDVDGELPELRHIASSFAEWRGRFWVAERQRRIVGCVGCTPSAEPGGLELKKLYVAESERVSGLGSRLVSLVEQEARVRRARFIDLWSDTRFVTAHRFYERRGYQYGGVTRELHDKSDTVEGYFRKAIQLGRT
jgi:putative acetyltransferase